MTYVPNTGAFISYLFGNEAGTYVAQGLDTGIAFLKNTLPMCD